MAKRVVPLPPGVQGTLKETASRMGPIDLDTLIAAAVWAFARLDRDIKAAILREFWYSGISVEPVPRKQSFLRSAYELGKHLVAQIF